MTQRSTFRIKCNSIDYRRGFIEVIQGIHDGCVNIETWGINSETELGDVAWVDHPSIPESSVLDNTELEMTIEQARSLANALLAAADSLEQP